MIPLRLPVRADIFGLLLLANAGCAEVVKGAVPNPPLVATTTAAAFDVEPPVGSVAPDFVAAGHDGANVSLSSLRGRTVILFFYTKDETPKAIREAIDFRDAWRAGLSQRGVVVVGVSTDDADAHKKFADRLGLPFRLVSDPEGIVARAYGVPAEYGVMDRRTFVIKSDGTIERVYRNVDVDSHVSTVVADLNRG